MLLKTHTGVIWYAAGISYGIITSLFIVGMLISFRSTRIYLTRSHERSKTSSETIRKYAVAAITFVLGVFVTELIHRLFK